MAYDDIEDRSDDPVDTTEWWYLLDRPPVSRCARSGHRRHHRRRARPVRRQLNPTSSPCSSDAEPAKLPRLSSSSGRTACTATGRVGNLLPRSGLRHTRNGEPTTKLVGPMDRGVPRGSIRARTQRIVQGRLVTERQCGEPGGVAHENRPGTARRHFSDYDVRAHRAHHRRMHGHRSSRWTFVRPRPHAHCPSCCRWARGGRTGDHHSARAPRPDARIEPNSVTADRMGSCHRGGCMVRAVFGVAARGSHSSHSPGTRTRQDSPRIRDCSARRR
jgi:hypothetical protein